jgi:uncharacterized protein (DUF2147 family)
MLYRRLQCRTSALWIPNESNQILNVDRGEDPERCFRRASAAEETTAAAAVAAAAAAAAAKSTDDDDLTRCKFEQIPPLMC